MMLIILGSLLTVLSVLPYMIEIIQGKTKPRIVSWFIWTVLTSIAATAALVEHQYATAVLLSSAAIETTLIVVIGWKNGNKKIEKLDVYCLLGAIVGIMFWIIFNSPAIAVVATILIDLIGGIPTLVHSWKRPAEETWFTFMLASLGAVCTLLVINDWRISSFAYPLYLVVVNAEFMSVIIIRRHVLSK